MSTMANFPSSYTYFPSRPPSKNTKPSYSRFVLSAPVTALADVTPFSKKPTEFQLSANYRVRMQVGSTNRWRAPSALGSDLLGTSQAIRAIKSAQHDRKRLIKKERLGESFQKHDYLENLVQMRGGLRSEPIPSRFERNSESTRTSKYEKNADSSSKIRKQCSTKEEPFSLRHLNYMYRTNSFVPPDRRRPTPVETFVRLVQMTSKYNGIDLIVNALNTNWNLNIINAKSSGLLSYLMQESVAGGTTVAAMPTQQQQQFREIESLDDFVVSSERQGVTVSIPRIPSYSERVPVFLNLSINDDFITRHTFATALCFLYDESHEFESIDVISILASAHYLQMERLKMRCAEVMMDAIDSSNAFVYHSAAKKYELSIVENHCEKWLELHIVTELCSQTNLSHLSFSLLEKLITSKNLFVQNEYSFYKLLCNWTFLKQHPTLQLLPQWGTVVTWFMSIPIASSFLECDEGKQYKRFFKSLRQNGFTDPGELDEISKMNIMPSEWLLKVFTQHYYSVQGGGDMSLMTRFEDGAIRYGFVFEEPNQVYNKVLSLHGFHFDVIADLSNVNQCKIYMQRLRPLDPRSSQRISDRQTFSVRHDREVRYAIRAQYYDGKSFIVENTGPKSQCFGLNGRNERSEALKIEYPAFPLYVTFSLVFPPS